MNTTEFIRKGFLFDPDKLEAVIEYGLEAAKELWSAGVPPENILELLRTNAVMRFLLLSKKGSQPIPIV